MGKPILFWLLDELHMRPDDLIVIAYNTDLERWRMEDRLRKMLGSRCLRIVHLPGPTRGAAETVSIALERERSASARLYYLTATAFTGMTW